MTLLEKIFDSLNDETKAVVMKVDLSKSAQEIDLALEKENIVCFNTDGKHDQEIH